MNNFENTYPGHMDDQRELDWLERRYRQLYNRTHNENGDFVGEPETGEELVEVGMNMERTREHIHERLAWDSYDEDIHEEPESEWDVIGDEMYEGAKRDALNAKERSRDRRRRGREPHHNRNNFNA